MVSIDLERERLILKLPDGISETVSVEPGAWSYSCEGPSSALVDLALGHGRNESGGNPGARTVETIAALVASAQTDGAPAAVDLSLGPSATAG
jgi:hypothetical protein